MLGTIVAIGSRIVSQSYTIGELANQTGVKVVTIRYYEQIGVLPVPARSLGNYRVYCPEHLRRLQFIRRGRDLGFSLDQVRQMLRLSSKDAPSCAEICAISAHHLEDIEDKVRDLRRLAKELRRINSSCSGNKRMADCRIIEAHSRD